jgi:hypothetical protein
MAEGLEEYILERVAPGHKASDKARPFQGRSLLSALEVAYGRRLGDTNLTFAQRSLSSSDFPAAIANVFSKAIKSRLEIQPSTFEAWTNSNTLSDFKESSRIRVSEMGSLRERNEGSEYHHSVLSDEQEKASLKQWGVVHAFTDRLLINDDTGSIRDAISRAGVSVSRLENQLAYQALKTNRLMLSGENLYSSAHGNQGTPGAISKTTFAEAYLKMRTQTAVGGTDALNIEPRFLIVGPELEVEAKEFLAAIQPNETANVNVFSNSVQLVVSAEISNDEYFFVADPRLIETVTMFRLAGHESPRVEARTNWNTDSLEIKIAHSVNALATEYRGLLRNKKTAY